MLNWNTEQESAVSASKIPAESEKQEDEEDEEDKEDVDGRKPDYDVDFGNPGILN